MKETKSYITVMEIRFNIMSIIKELQTKSNGGASHWAKSSLVKMDQDEMGPGQREEDFIGPENKWSGSLDSE